MNESFFVKLFLFYILKLNLNNTMTCENQIEVLSSALVQHRDEAFKCECESGFKIFPPVLTFKLSYRYLGISIGRLAWQ